MIALHASHVFDGAAMLGARTVLCDDGEIVDIVEAADATTHLLPPDTILAPGFIDLQVNGGGGVMFNDATNLEGLRTIAAAHSKAGTTSILPTLISGARTLIAAAIDAVRDARELPGILGLHVEGPFLAPTRRGIHPANAITVMTDADVAMLSSHPDVRMLVTLAPEMVSPARISALAQHGIIVFAGHSDAVFTDVDAALRAGVSGFTHLYNAMSPLGGRAPGMVGAALAASDAYAGIIVDGHHVHPIAVGIAHSAKGPGRLFLVSDAMATAAAETTEFLLYGTPVHLSDGMLTDAAGTLAGAHLTMAEAVRNAVTLVGLPLLDALTMATATPAACLGVHDRGTLAPGMRADIVALNPDLSVQAVWQGGVRLA